MERIADGIYALDGLKTGRAYLIEDSDGLMLIDTSSADVTQRIIDAIASIGRRPDELRTIVATHYHYDHTGNVAALVERTGATFCAHAIEAPYIDGRQPWMAARGAFAPLASAMAPKPFAVPVGRELQTGEKLDAAGGLDVIHAPGHTPGHMALHAKARRVLFAGDAFQNPAGLFLPVSIASHDMDEAKRTIARLSELDFDIALPGHGRPLIGRANEKLAEWSRRWLRS